MADVLAGFLVCLPSWLQNHRTSRRDTISIDVLLELSSHRGEHGMSNVSVTKEIVAVGRLFPVLFDVKDRWVIRSIGIES